MTITYTLSDTDDAATVTFYYDKNNKGFNGKPISGECASTPEGTDMTCIWNTHGVKQGHYYIYGVASDGSNTVSTYSSDRIRLLKAKHLKFK